MSDRRKEVSSDLRLLVVKLNEEGRSLNEISKIVKKSKSTVQTIVRNYKTNGSLLSKPRSGRPHKLSERDEQRIITQIKANPRKSAREIAVEISKNTGRTIHRSTISRIINRAGFRNRTARKKPFISKINRQKRLSFAIAHVLKPMDFWDTVIFSDESKYNIYGNDGKVRVWRNPNCELKSKNTVGTVKHGWGSVMVWGCMSSRGVGKLVFVEQTMTRFGYLNILKDNLKVSAQGLGLGEKFCFQQDNDPKHTSYIVQEWLLYNCPHQLKTPPQSPDMNPIEHLWEELERRIRNHNIKSKSDLKNALQTEWNRIESTVTQKLVASMRKRLEEVIKYKGGPTSY